MADGEDFAAREPHVPVPLALLLDTRVSDAAKVLWALLYRYSVTGGVETFAMSQAEMATLSGATPPSVRTRRDELSAAGWLDVTVLPGMSRKQQLTVRTPGTHVPLSQER